MWRSRLIFPPAALFAVRFKPIQIGKARLTALVGAIYCAGDSAMDSQLSGKIAQGVKSSGTLL
ncbi:hypothetical protein MPC4_290014 [Methylocella tundrae]|uniref:Uncharacterized protein n=1 Tax=Methylocella tundrae TaxID=227605 RepID=A0A8B6M7I6_METTU|nr:hypothetical protein MPC4_290014 [Methylocella tundrae]